MICYRDRCYCADQEECGTMECSRRLTQADRYRAATLGLPIAWTPYKDTCGKHTEKEESK
jgi:hypothetical protein